MILAIEFFNTDQPKKNWETFDLIKQIEEK